MLKHFRGFGLMIPGGRRMSSRWKGNKGKLKMNQRMQQESVKTE